MKKNLQNAMTKNFQNMVGIGPNQDENTDNTTPVKTQKPVAKASQTKTAVIEEPEIEPEKVINTPTPVVQQQAPPVAPVVAAEPAPVPSPVQTQQPVVQPIVAPVQAPVETSVPVQPVPMPQMVEYAQPVQPVQPEPVYNSQFEEPEYVEEPIHERPVGRRSNKKAIPLMPEEKSSGVLHIRLGELRSYVDFMTQSGKISYQQYISNLIEQDYEKNKDLYLKYKSFMDQLNF